MATNPYVNKVIYGNTTVMDISGDTVTASDVAQGKTFHDATGEQKTGSYVAPTITQITPSNSSPVTLTGGNNYQPTANGKAVASVTDVTPSNTNITSVSANDVIRTTTNGQVIYGLADVTPSNSQPIEIDQANTIVRFDSAGVIVESIDRIDPNNTLPDTITNGDVYKAYNDGYAIRSFENLYPDNDNPPHIYRNHFYLATGNGFAIEEGYQEKTPSSSGTQFSAGFVKMSSAGYAYSTRPTPTKTTLWTNPDPTVDFDSATGNDALQLSDDMDNYDYLEFTFRIVKTGTDDYTMLVPVSEFKQSSSGSGIGKFRYAFNTSNASYQTGFRRFYYKSDTEVEMTQNTIYRTNNANVNIPSQSIPVYIKGVKWS